MATAAPELTAKGHITTVKCALLGNGAVGKTALLATYLLKTYPTFVAPGPLDWFQEEWGNMVNQPVLIADDTEIHLIDTTGLDEYEKIRALVCAGADFYLLCYDVSTRASFEDIRRVWVKRMRSYSGAKVHFGLVALKTDLRQGHEGDMTQFVTSQEGEKEAKSLKADFFIECSAKENADLSDVFKRTREAVLKKSQSVCSCS